MSTYTITGGAQTSGDITVSGSKNAALPMIASTLFFETAELKMLDISDVHLMKEILESLGSKVSFEKNTFTVDNKNLSLENIRQDLFKKHEQPTISSLPPGSIWWSKSTYPGGCSIGKRPIDGIVRGLEQLGYASTQIDEMLAFKGQSHDNDITVNAYFSVGSTIVLLLAALKRTGTTRIELAAYEPHVMNMIDVLRDAGADIALRYDHTIIIKA